MLLPCRQGVPQPPFPVRRDWLALLPLVCVTPPTSARASLHAAKNDRGVQKSRDPLARVRESAAVEDAGGAVNWLSATNGCNMLAWIARAYLGRSTVSFFVGWNRSMNRFSFLLYSAIFALALGLSGVVAEEEDWVTMKPGDFGAETEFLDRFVFEEYERDVVYVTAYSRERNIYVGRYDINGDGAMELFLFNSHSSWCGSAGCLTYIFEGAGDNRRDIGGGPLTINVMDERVCGYRSLKGSDGIYRWTGEYYGLAYCFPDRVECRSMAIEYDNPERLDPDNGLIAPDDCPKPDRAKR